MIKYRVVHEIMLFYISTAFVVLLPDCQFLITCINCGCFMHLSMLGRRGGRRGKGEGFDE
jgi:hypothetical protein